MYSHIAISGGGIKGAAILGALSVLYKKELLNLKAFIGSSVGGLICFLLNIGYTHTELKEILLNIDFAKYRDINFSAIIDKWGFDSGNELMKLLVAIVKQKNINPDITFKELHIKTDQLLVLTGSELKNNKIIYYNYETYPDMRVLDAIRITISFPIVFYPTVDNNEVLIDGAMFSPYPIDYFKDIKDKIGIIIYNRHDNNNIDSCENYLVTLVKLLGQRYEKLFLQDYIENSIVIEVKDINGMDFNMSKESKLLMFKLGQDSTTHYLSEINAKKASPLRSPV